MVLNLNFDVDFVIDSEMKDGVDIKLLEETGLIEMFLVLINQDVGAERIEKVLEESSFTPFNYNTPFKSKGNRSICLRFNLDKSRESELIDMLELFN